MMEGGPSHIDTFDPKPKLAKLHLKEFNRAGEQKSAMESGKRYFVQSPFEFRQAGESGAWMSDPWQHLASVADDLCFYRGCQVDSVNHPTAMYQMNSGNRFGGDPAIGSWVTYGLGSTEPGPAGFRRPAGGLLPAGRLRRTGATATCPPTSRARPLRPKGSPILDLKPPTGRHPRELQRANLDLLAKLNRAHQQQHPHHGELAARMDSYELAFRMQMGVPDAIDIESETGQIKEVYGVGRDDDRRLRPQVPAGAQAGRERRALRPALRRQLGQPRLHRARPRQPRSGRSTNRSPP